ncbi:armadillo-type protein [Polychytrium aggregatum]|uniref:armadillo-type protein n=1 Tax=Polychytrium aggregatum TaxID=110093 RepID=UPI0022FEFB20|nr:armadillo-type protein [Polychytrium aggregatum]KAI9197136.1 armadillo-type protein [Polychytrium aggregatum]
MDAEQTRVHFEHIVAELQRPAARPAAEKALEEFKSIPNAVLHCQYIIEKTESSQTLFFASSALSELAAKEYSIRPKSEIQGLRDYLINRVLQAPDSALDYSRTNLLRSAAIIVKRGWLYDTREERQSLLHTLSSMVATDGYIRLVGLAFLKLLLDEFQSKRMSSVGLPWVFHASCREAFESNDLRSVFELVQKMLRVSLAQKPQLDSSDVLAAVILEAILSWDFAPTKNAGLSGDFEEHQLDEDTYDAEVAPTRFPESWKTQLLDSEVLSTILQLHTRLLASNHAHLSRSILIRYSSLSGPLLAEKDTRLRHYVSLCAGVLQLVKNFSIMDVETDEAGSELIGLCQIARRILLYSKLEDIISTGESEQFFSELGRMTEMCLSKFDTLDDGDHWLAATDELLVMWSAFVFDLGFYVGSNPPSGIQNHSRLQVFLEALGARCFQLYVDRRLTLAARVDDDDADDTIGIRDRDLYGDQLLYITTLGRVSAIGSLSKLATLWAGALEQFRSSTLLGGAGISTTLNEQLCWLIVISGHLCADSGIGETPAVPQAFDKQEIFGMLSSIVQSVMQLWELVNVQPTDPLALYLSPLLTENITWFVDRWSRTYLCMEDITSASNGPTATTFGVETLNIILRNLHGNFHLWNSDEGVLQITVSVLETYANMNRIRNALFEQQPFLELVTFLFQNLGSFPSSIHCSLIQAITTIATHVSSDHFKALYFSNLSSAIESRLDHIIQQINSTNYENPEIALELINVMEMYIGVHLSADEYSSVAIFGMSAKQFDTCLKLLHYYRNNPQVEIYLLQFFQTLVSHLALDMLAVDCLQQLFKATIDLIRVYTENNSGRVRRQDKGEEDEILDDIKAVLVLLSELIDWGSAQDVSSRSGTITTPSDPGHLEVQDVVYYGISHVIPLITADMLNNASLCLNLVSTIGQLLDTYPHRFDQLPSQMISNMMKTLEFGLNSHVLGIARGSFSAVARLALFKYWEQHRAGVVLGEASAAILDQFLLQVFDILLFKSFNYDLMEAASEALFGLTLARKAVYMQAVHRIVEHQESPDIRSRLMSAFQLLTAAAEESERLHQSLGPTSRNGVMSRAFKPYSAALVSFLMEVRGYLRLK